VGTGSRETRVSAVLTNAAREEIGAEGLEDLEEFYISKTPDSRRARVTKHSESHWIVEALRDPNELTAGGLGHIDKREGSFYPFDSGHARTPQDELFYALGTFLEGY
jgi:hypothetical protein